MRLNEFKNNLQETTRAADELVRFGFILGLATIAAIFLVAVPVTRSINRNLTKVVQSLKEISQENGDLTKRLQTQSQDEIGDLVFWFNSFIEKLQGIVNHIVETSQPLESVAQHLIQVSEGANHSIGLQRSGANRAKRAMEEMSDSVTEVALNAAAAAKAASEANDTAREGQKTVAQTVSSIQRLAEDVMSVSEVIHRLEDDSARVGSVLDVIKSIAEQTNLLALNAAIEAARAGEQGRGFAVVADEVRTLASRTQESTAEIQVTIEDLQQVAKSAVEVMAKSASQAQESVVSANNAGTSLDAINQSINNMDSMNEKIALATEAQARVSADVVNIITEIHDSSEQTAERSSSLQKVSSELVSLAQAMSKITQQFRV